MKGSLIYFRNLRNELIIGVVVDDKNRIFWADTKEITDTGWNIDIKEVLKNSKLTKLLWEPKRKA